MKTKYNLTFLISGIVIILDQATKFLVEQKMALWQSIEIIPNFFHLTHVRNTGAAFGFLAGIRSPGRTLFFVFFSLLAIGGIIYLLRGLRPDQRSMIFSLSLILGGAIGNLLDRLRLGEVIDFLDLHWYDWHWPAFNIADSAISVGVFLLFLQMLQKKSISCF